MEETQIEKASFAQRTLPWLVGLGALILYSATLNHWVSFGSLPWTATVAGWDWSLPQQAPIFVTLTSPIRLIPTVWQPLALNVFAALCASLALVLLARSVALLPQDRTHEQRQRERSELSLLSTPTAWIPPVLAAAVCGLEWTFWENAIAISSEMINLLLLAYPIRCLLEYRLDQRDAWLYKASFVFALGITNNAGMIGLLPLFVAAIAWMMGRRFFDGLFLARMTAFGAAGLAGYLVLPILWTVVDSHFGLLQVLRWNLGAQKSFLTTPGLRNQAVLLSFTSLLPVALMGIRWPSSFGDTSAAGTRMTQLMLRVMHLLFLAVCIWVAFDFDYSPRALGMGYSFLSFYYLSAIAIGYYSGYVLLVFTPRKSRTRHRPSASSAAVNLLVRFAVIASVIVIPAALIFRNLPLIRGENGEILKDFARFQAQSLPDQPTVVLSDDPYALLLLDAYLSCQGAPQKHLLLYTKALPMAFYQRRLEERYPGRWKNLSPPESDASLDPGYLLDTLVTIAQRTIPSTPIYYLHPSFGYYFERFYSVPSGLALQLKLYNPNEFFPPDLNPQTLRTNLAFWTHVRPELDRAQKLSSLNVADAVYVAGYYSRALNDWGVKLQRQNEWNEAAPCLELAAGLSTNNIPASVNLAFNRSFRAGKPRPLDLTPESIEDRFGANYRQWDQVLMDNGPFDTPDFCYSLGGKLSDQSLTRQAAIEFRRAGQLEPDNPLPQLSLATIFLNSKMPDETLAIVSKLRQSEKNRPGGETNQIQIAQLEAGVYFAKQDLSKAEQLLLSAQQRFPSSPIILDSLIQFYMGQDRWTNALQAIDRSLALEPQNPALLFRKAALYANTKNFAQAQQLIDLILKTSPRDVSALLFKGSALLQTREFDRAIAVFEQVLDIDPSNLDAQLSEGAAYLEKKQYAKSIPLFTAVLKKRPSDWAALRNRAIASLGRGALDQARQDYEALLAIAPNYYPAFFGLAEIAYQKKDTAAAIRNYNLYLKYVPNSTAPELANEKKQVLDRLKQLRPAKS